jgi:serine/threonine protein kinase
MPTPQIVEALQILAKDSVVHFDLKCSNILIDPLPGVKDSELWNPLGVREGVREGGSSPAASTRVPFQTVLADFGEARSYRNAEEAFTTRNRGTEVYNSPEMLLMNNRGGSSISSWQVSAARLSSGSRPPLEEQAAASLGAHAEKVQKQAPGTASSSLRRSTAVMSGAGLASDVWSLGCLAFELLSGSVLFSGDYASVTHRVAFGGQGPLRLTHSEQAALGNRGELVDFIEWVLERDPSKRPSLNSIGDRLGLIEAQLQDEKSIQQSP